MFEALAAIDRWAAAGHVVGARRRDDVTLSLFVANQLTTVIPQMYDRMYPLLDARTHIPFGLNVPASAMAWAYDSMDKRGRAQWMGANANDIPRSDVAVKRTTFPIRTAVCGYGWTIEEIEAAVGAGVGGRLSTSKPEATRRAMAEFENNVLLQGDASHGIPGFLTNPANPRMNAVYGSWTGGTTTADQIITDLNTATNQVYAGSGRVHVPTTVLLPLAEWRWCMTTRLSNTLGTIAEFFLRTNGWVSEILGLPDMATASPAGGKSMLVYQKDPMVLSGIVPLGFTQMEPQVHGFEVVTPCRQKAGGTVWMYPHGGLFVDGI